jgi:hypothetical protein
VRPLTRNQRCSREQASDRNRENGERIVEGVQQPDLAVSNEANQVYCPRSCGHGSKRIDREMHYWNSRGRELGTPQSGRPEASDERLELGAIQSFRDHCHLALAASEVEFASHE